MTMSSNMMIGYGIYDCFTMEHFRDIFDVHPIESYISYQVSSVPLIGHTSFLHR
jgi:hypothetical protein